MPTLYRGNEQVVTEDRAEIARLIAAGFELPPSAGGNVPVAGSSGAVTSVPVGSLPYALDANAAPVPGGEQVAGGIEAQRELNYDNNLGTALAGAGSVLSFGLSDVALDAAGVPISEYAKYNPVAHGIGTAAGIAATILTPMGLEAAGAKVAGEVGALTKVGRALPTTKLSAWAGGAETALGRVARTAGEGAAYGLGQEVSNVALSDPQFSGEHTVADMAIGTFLGAVFGAVGGAAGEAYGAARKAHLERKALQGIDWASGPGKAIVEAQANAHKTIEEMVEFTARTDADDVAAQVAAHTQAGQTARAGDVAIAETAARNAYKSDAIPQMQDAIRDVRRAIDEAAQAPAAAVRAPESFGQTVTRVADSIDGPGRFGDRKVFISDAYEAIKREPGFENMSLDEFKKQLVKHNKGGPDGLTLSRADYVSAMDPERVAASHVKHMNADFNFIVSNKATKAVAEALPGPPSMYNPDDVTALWTSYNSAAKAAGAARLSKAELKAVTKAAEAGNMVPLAELAAKADDLVKATALHDATAERALAKFNKTGSDADAVAYLKHLHSSATERGIGPVAQAAEAGLKRGEQHAARAAELKVASPARGVSPAEARTALGHVADAVPGTDAFMRITRMQPAEQTAAISKIGKYWDTAIAATKHNPVASMRIRDAMAQLGEAYGGVLTKETSQLLTPEIMAAALGVGVSQLPIGDVPGPVDDLLKIVVVQRLASGMLRTRGPATGLRGVLNKAARAIGRGAAGTAAAATVRAHTGGLPGLAQAAAIGGGSAAGRSGFEMLAGGRGLKGVVQATDIADARIKSAVERIGSGSPGKRRAMPGLDVIFNKLLPDSEHTSKKPAEKFKVIQDRLTQYGTAPQSFSAKFYEVLRPVQQVSAQLADSMETTLGTHLQHALDTMPRDPGTMMMLGKSMWKPTDRQLYEWGLGLLGSMFPLDVVDMVADGLVPPQAVQALQTTNPATFAKFQAHVVDHVDDIRANSTYDQRIALGLAFALPLDPTTDPRYVAFMQSMHAQKTMQQAAGSAAEDKSPEESYSDAQKMLA